MRTVWLGLLTLAVAFAQAPNAQVQQAQRNRDTYEGAYDPAEPPRFNQGPNGFLMECIKNRKPGRALDVGMGNGRNSIALAQAGWQVTGFDIASLGVAHARSKAAQLGLQLTASVQSDQDFNFGTNQWDLVVLTYQPFREILNRVKASLK
ncbi:MAG: class I SAM-dependent methyltransferase [Bryobacteraceae bacterium]